MDIQLKRGSLDVCVLAALLREDSYGYKIIQSLEGVIEISESTLYPILKRLEATKCLTSYTVEHNGRLRRFYSITENGVDKIKDYLTDFKQLMQVYEFIGKEVKKSVE
ncbi:MAG: PadR family transcriptional regulator [Erysipelotrichaceae bacterium]|nr:PadR family transcriptional regulator [Erysipelotrichaceae bacterium]MBR6232689.1 PadR family transcriptional regulator [Erysipelotrichaceae bacterium]